MHTTASGTAASYFQCRRISAPELVPLAGRNFRGFGGGKGKAFNYSPGIIDEQALREALTELGRSPLEGVFQHGRAVFGVMGITGDEVHEVALQEFDGEGTRCFAKAAQKGLSGDLEEAAFLHPAFKRRQALLEELVALRVSDDREDSGGAHSFEHLGGVLKNDHVGEFDHEVGLVADGVLAGIRDGVLNIVEGEVEIATLMDTGMTARSLGEFLHTLADEIRLECVLQVGMRGGDNIRRPGIGRHAQHRHAFLQGFGTVVQPIEDVAVDIDQINISSS